MFKLIKHKYQMSLVFALIALSSIQAQDISVKATMDSMAMIIGHQTKLTLELSKPNQAEVAFPLILDTLVDKVEVISRTPIDTTALSPDRQLLSQELTIASFDSGFYYIPPFEFEIQEKSGGGSLFTDPLALKIYTYKIDSIQGVFDIKPIKKVPLTFQEAVPYLSWSFVTILLILIGIWIYWRSKNKGSVFAHKPEPSEPPYIIAFRELERIRAEKLWQKDKTKEYYTDLTNTLRSYIEGRFQVLAMEQTSEEILRDIKGLIDKDDYQKLKNTLELADYVKFAKMTPLMDDSERCIKEAYAFVDHTKPSLVDESDTNDENQQEETTEVKS